MHHALRYYLFATLLSFGFVSQAQAEDPLIVPLWKKGPPGFEKLKDEPEEAEDYWVKHIRNPSLMVYRADPKIANGTAVLIAPGGGQKLLVINGEGRDPALYFNKLGITAIVLKYRLAEEAGSPYAGGFFAQEDAYRAIRTLRSRAKEFGIAPDKIGFMGFSAGGEVVSSVAYAAGDGNPKAKDPIDRLNGKPNFQILIYPGSKFIPTQLDSHAPPAFMLAAIDDINNSKPLMDLIQLYHGAKIPAELHIYAQGGHAFNMGYRSTLKTLHTWPDRLTDWLDDSGYLKVTVPQVELKK